MRRPESSYSSCSPRGRTTPPQRGAAAIAPAARTAACYTRAHAGLHLRLGPIAFWVTVGSLVIMAAWTMLTATYFAFHDDVLTSLIARPAEMQVAQHGTI